MDVKRSLYKVYETFKRWRSGRFLKMSAFEVYKDYLALKNHFSNKNYDYFKYKGKVRTSIDSFNKRKDKIFFEKN
jgi:hypothetical protein